LYAHFTRLFTYNDWANRRVLTALREIEPWPPKVADRMSHLLVSQQIWYTRAMNIEPPADLWPKYSIEELEAINLESTQQWLGLTADIKREDRAKVVQDKNSAGTPFETMIVDIMTHVINHSTHHRAQIIASLRDAGHEPPQTDFIFFARETTPAS